MTMPDSRKGSGAPKGLWRIVARAVERVLRLQGIVGEGQSGAQSDCSAVRSSINNLTQHVAPRAIAAVAPIRIVLGVLDELGFRGLERCRKHLPMVHRKAQQRVHTPELRE